MNTLLDIQNVVKKYNDTVAVDGLSVAIPKQAIFGMLGPNGAGKTSLIRMITQITAPDEGTILFNGEPIKRMHTESIGYMPEERGLYKQMKVGDQVMYLAQLRGLAYGEAKKRVHAWFERFDIESWWNKKVEELSKGMQQKVQFIATVVHNPELLILDEPFSGLDPINTDLIKDEISELQKAGTTIIFSTHRMEQVEEICSSIILVNKGKKILDGDVKAIKQQFKKNQYRVHYAGAIPVIDHPEFKILEKTDHEFNIQTQPATTPNALLSYLMNKVEIHGFNEVLPSLNEIFIEQVTGGHHE
ncbi:MAG: ATP-binding cassette domain-containing protein [Bacteroidetes bacterium]|nr:ATP-binding cassette domain-containing protein [Bacteroidota bacterium]